MGFKAKNQQEYTVPICHWRIKPSSNKNVKVVTSDMSKRTLISDILSKLKVSGFSVQVSATGFQGSASTILHPGSQNPDTRNLTPENMRFTLSTPKASHFLPSTLQPCTLSLMPCAVSPAPAGSSNQQPVSSIEHPVSRNYPA